MKNLNWSFFWQLARVLWTEAAALDEKGLWGCKLLWYRKMHTTSSEKSRENDINLGSNEDWENVKFEKPVGTKLIFPNKLNWRETMNGRLDTRATPFSFFLEFGVRDRFYAALRISLPMNIFHHRKICGYQWLFFQSFHMFEGAPESSCIVDALNIYCPWVRSR